MSIINASVAMESITLDLHFLNTNQDPLEFLGNNIIFREYMKYVLPHLTEVVDPVN